MVVIEMLRRDVVETGLKLIHNDLTHGTCGNISCRIPNENKILVTPSKIAYKAIKPQDLLLIDLEGNILEGSGKPSVETPFHLAIYNKRDNIGAIIHTHSLYTLAVSASVESVPVFLDEIFSNIGGKLDVSKYAVPGSTQLAENIVKTLKDKNALLMANHGAICCGKNIKTAYETLEAVEKICKIFVFSSVFGKTKVLPQSGVDYQRVMFKERS
jgi:L-fuculose-phosphate aldolase